MSYAGDLTPLDAFQMLIDVDGASLVDVRTKPELAYVGRADLSGLDKPVHHLEWQCYPDGRLNEAFVKDLVALGFASEDPILFLCRSGNRSAHAARAATEAGYTNAFNIENGFEGPTDARGHRGVVAGWKVDGLPWSQS